MSCGLLVAASLLIADPSVAADAAAPAPAPAASVAPASVAHEPLFADIVSRSRDLKAVVDGWMAGSDDPAADAFSAFKARTVELAALDMQGHVTLKERGTDGDLKCILRGISEDLPLKLKALEEAKSTTERDTAIADMGYLLNDNVEVITAPPQAPV